MTATEASDSRPGLAVVVNTVTPYRVHLHERLAAEIPEFKLHSVFTHASGEFQWDLELPEAIHPIGFAEADESTTDPAWKRLGSDYRKAGRIIRYFVDHDVRAVVLMGYNDLTRLRLASVCRRMGIAVFLRGDSNIKGEPDGGGVRQWIKRRVVGYAIRRSDVVMPMGRLGQAFFEKYGARPEQCVWVPYEPDYRRFRDVPPDDVDAFRAKHGITADRRYILFCGRFVEVKRVDLLIDAFSRIAAERPEWGLLLAGDGPLRDALQQRMPEHLRPRGHWLGFLDVAELTAAYHAADVLVLPSDYEPWALVVNEAMAAGLVVVASDVVGAAYELVQDGRNGRLFPAGDVDALAEALHDVTDPNAIDRCRAEVGPALEDWRRKADPVAGVRQALRRVNLLS